ncbi:MAG: TlpA family protein disulfide reductase [Oligoflexales bacterium]|nr:TlpA family protein disulfide reductase [Oligoflexales bacterium]
MLHRLADIFCVAGICLALNTSNIAYAESGAAKPAAPAETAASTPVPDGISESYVHQWIKFPHISAQKVVSAELNSVVKKLDHKIVKGEANVVFFIASWCIPCQELISAMKDLEQKYHAGAVNFIYVFTHDTSADAAQFIEKNPLSNAVLANDEVLRFFRNPPLPSFYVGDKHGWLTMRRTKFNAQALKELDDFLKLQTVL